MFGLSFGKNKEKTDQTQTVDQTVTGTQNQTGTNQTNSQTNQTSSSTGSSTTSGSTNQATKNTGVEQTTQTTTGFDKNALDALGGGIGQFINKVLSSPANGGTALSALGDFDSEQFINSTLLAARNTQGTKLGEVTRGITSLIGGNAKENSASAILSDRATNDAAATLAGIEADTRAKAASIENERAGTISGIGTADTNALAQLLGAIKGGTQTSTGTTASDQTTGTTGSTTGTTNTSEQSSQQTNQALTEIINQLIASNQNTQGTTNIKGSTTKSGGGVSLGL